jgi:hypothetical protein
MKPEELIKRLKEAAPGSTGRLILSEPITNVPLGELDLQAAKVLDFMWNEVLSDTDTLQDALNLIAEVQWWIVFFTAFNDDKGFERVAQS